MQKKKDEILNVLAKKANADKLWPPLFSIGRGTDYVVFEFTPEKMRGLDARIQTLSSEEPPYVTLV